jgi:CelD/BcsL family acetyltransferase involved in cellulose biosynthesis
VVQPRAAEKCLRYLSPDEYPLWDSLLETSAQGSVFCRSWWLRAVGGEVRVLGYFEHGRLVAGIPLYFERRFGIRFCCTPKLTHTWGVVMQPPAGKRASAASREMEILRVFAERLAKERTFVQAFHPSVQNWLPFYWNHFRQTSGSSYVLDNLRDSEQIWNGMKGNIRREIRKAEKRGIRVSPCDASEALATIIKTFDRQRLKLPFGREYFRGLFQAAKQNEAGECFAAKDSQGRIHAAAFLVWDTKRAYYLAGGGDPNLRTSGATSLLMWHLIQFSAARSAVFDFEGSDLGSVERLFRSFGARQEPYNFIRRFPRWMGTCLFLAGKI